MTNHAPAAGHGLDTVGGLTLVKFVEDADGSLVDIVYVCAGCSFGTEERAPALRWPAFEWPDYDVHCAECSALVNRAGAGDFE